MKNSSIEWTDHTFNPWIGCAKVSPGCAHCYADTLNTRFRRAEWQKDGYRHRTSESYWKQPARWNEDAMESGEQKRVFCASLADVFETNANAPLHQWRDDLHEILLDTPFLEWLLLSKRPENIAPYYGDRGIPSNVWLGTSVENQEYAQRRIPELIQNQANVRFLSCEPLLGPLDLRPWLSEIDWVIVGGESGPGWREMPAEWARDVRDQCVESGVPYFFKQYSALHPHKMGRALDGKEWNQIPERKDRVRIPELTEST